MPDPGSGPAGGAAPGESGGGGRWLLWAVPVAAAALAYRSALWNGFVWDDPLVLRQLRAIHGVGDLLVVPSAIPRMYYRPVIFASYLLDRWLGGEQPFWFHASVIAWHVANTALVFALARRLFEGLNLAAAGAALLFAIHPAHVESVAWMAGRSDVIACAFLLASVLLFQRPGVRSAWLAGAAMLASVLAKEPVMLAGVLFPLVDRAQRRRSDGRRYLPLAAAFICYLVLRQVGVGMIGEPVAPGWESPVRLVRAAGFYAITALAPVRQTVFASDVPGDAVSFVVGVLALIAFSGGFAWAWMRRDGVVVLGLSWVAVTLAPALALVLRHIASTPVAERYVYIPSVGVVLLVAYGAAALARRVGRGVVVVLFVAGAVAGMVEVGRRNGVWSDEIRFWTAAAQAAPSAMPQRELADALLRGGDLAGAERAYLAALERPDTPEQRAMTYANFGNLYRRLDRVDEAIALFQQGLEVARHPSVYHGLGFALMRRAQLAQMAGDGRAVLAAVRDARDAFERALQLGAVRQDLAVSQGWEPAKTHMLLGQVLFNLGERDAARRHLEEALRLEPQGMVAETARKFLAQLP